MYGKKKREARRSGLQRSYRSNHLAADIGIVYRAQQG